MTSLRERGLVALAEVARPHGLVGELRLKVYNLDSELLRRRPAVKLIGADGAERDVKITSVRDADKALLVKLAGVGDRNAAEALRGATLAVPRTALPPPEEGEFYAWDIEGARAILPGGEVVGLVKELSSYPTCDVLVVDREGKSRLEIPITDAFVERVDVEAGEVHLVTIDGLD